MRQRWVAEMTLHTAHAAGLVAGIQCYGDGDEDGVACVAGGARWVGKRAREG